MNKTKELMVQMMWELVGSIFVAIGIYNFAVQAKFPMTGFSGISIIFYRLFHIPIGFFFFIEYTCCDTLLQIIRKEVFYPFHSLYDCIFIDYRLCGTIISSLPRRSIISCPMYGSFWWNWLRDDLYKKFIYRRI